MVMLKPREVEEKARDLWTKDDIPEEFAWINKLSPLHLRIFLVEFADACKNACLRGEWDAVMEVLEDWEATAQLDANPKLAQKLMAPPEKKDYEFWEARGA